MEMKEQTYILAIASFGNIKDAAEHLHISSPALSVYLSSLEKYMGVALFDRIGKRFVPTQAGSLYLSHAKEMMEIRDRFQVKLKELKNDVSGTVHFGIHPRRTSFLLPQSVMEFSLSHPGIELVSHEMTSAEMFDGLADGSLDFIFTNKTCSNPNFQWIPVYEDSLVAVLNYDHPVKKEASPVAGSSLKWLDLRLLKDERFILQKEFQSSRIYTQKVLNDYGLKPEKIFVIENLETAAQMAAEGYGVAFNFHTYIRQFRYTKPVSYYLIGDADNKISYYIAVNTQKYIPAYCREFIQILKKYAILGQCD